MAIATAILVALSAYGVYYTQKMPTVTYASDTLCRYTQKADYDYVAHIKPNVLYETETIGRNETLFINLIKSIDLKFNYTFTATVEGNITTNCTVNTQLESTGEEKWIKPIDTPISIEKTEEAKKTTIISRLSYNITEIQELVDKIREDIGAYSMQYQIVLKAKIDVTDETTVGTIKDFLEPEIALKFIPRGTGGVIQITALQRNKSGSITTTRVLTNSLVISLQWVAIGALISCLSVGSFLTIQRYEKDRAEFNRLPEAERILRSSDVIESKSIPKLEAQSLASMEALEELADEYGLKIFHSKIEGKDIFFVTEGAIVYRYEAKAKAEVKEPIERKSEKKYLLDCPYCDKKALGLYKLEEHVKKEHPDKLEEFRKFIQKVLREQVSNPI